MKRAAWRHGWRMAQVVCLALAASGCATTSVSPEAGVSPDPLEPLNRRVFAFNTGLDRLLILPVARTYDRVLPEVPKRIVGNLLSNLLDPYRALNNLLQGKPREAVGDLLRFTFNSTLGFFGVMDLASDLGLEKHDEDFGQTLGVWGVPAGAYLVLPIAGPSSVRDAAGLGVDLYAAVINRFDDVAFRNSLLGLDLVHNRARLLPVQQLLDEALDPYLLARDSYLQRRRNRVFDGNPPRDD